MSKNKIFCNECEISFASNSSFYKHSIRYHNLVPIFSKICPFCDSRFSFNNFFQKHIQTEHPDFKSRYQEITFTCNEAFETWLGNTEKEEKCNFVRKTRSKVLSDGRKATYFVCSRSGKGKLKEKKLKRSKAGGSVKIGKTCPAYITCYTYESDGSTEIKVQMQLAHAGHELEVEKLRLAREDRLRLAELLKRGLSKASIVSEIRKEYPPDTRLGSIKIQDLQNISREFNIKNEVCQETNDVSIDVLIKNLESDKGNPLLIYKPINEDSAQYPYLKKEDFVLAIMYEDQVKIFETYGNNQCIMIDETYGANQYDFHLTTLFVSDENQEAFPAAVLYSSKVDTNIYVSFFNSIKSRLSVTDFNVKVFMSDDTPVFYDAWMQVFGSVEYCLICTWHVIRSMKKNLNSKVKNSEARKNMKKELLRVIYETDEAKFDSLTGSFVYKYVNDEKNFTDYFLSHYMTRSKMWATCFRKDLGINTNMKVEKWYSQIKYEEGHKKIIKRLDRSIQAVVHAISNKFTKVEAAVTTFHPTDQLSVNLEEQEEVYLVECDGVTHEIDKKQLKFFNIDKEREELDTLYQSLLKECTSVEHISALKSGLKSIKTQFAQWQAQGVTFTDIANPENFTFVIL